MVEVLHPGVAGVPKAEMREKLAKLYKVLLASRGAARPLILHVSTQLLAAYISDGRASFRAARSVQVSDATTIVLFGFKLAFGGGRSTGFGMIYDSTTAQKRFEPKHRLIKCGLAKAKTGARKQRKELKNRLKKLRGLKKSKAAAGSGA